MDNYNKLFMIIRKTDLLNYDEKNELQLYLMNLKEQVKKQKEVINKAIEYINQHWVIDDPVLFKNDLLEILEDKEV
jgi:hypothetical protein